jgi:photosystem II stability/assembly factor-like uncharacterized protein
MTATAMQSTTIGWAVLADNPRGLLRTINGGKNWSAAMPSAGVLSNPLIEPRFLSGPLAFIAVQSRGRILLEGTSNGGRTWMPMGLLPKDT